ncbi:MAG: class I SAM-dependent methyltransferase [Candidatus Acidiferrales bacterium]
MSLRAKSVVIDSEAGAVHAGRDAYGAKPTDYFSGARRDYVTELPPNPRAAILEVGCGEGGTGALALSRGVCGRYCAVELFPAAAERAKEKLTEVLVGNVEEMELPWTKGTFDALILSEVLEHLVDPWAVLRKIRPLLRDGASVFASSPNVSHYRVIAMLVRGQWTLADRGVMDRTHLRWFTPSNYRSLFESCGYQVDSVKELSPLSWKARAAMAVAFGRLRHLFFTQIDLRAHS